MVSWSIVVNLSLSKGFFFARMLIHSCAHLSCLHVQSNSTSNSVVSDSFGSAFKASDDYLHPNSQQTNRFSVR